jgi:hypothetical protein
MSWPLSQDYNEAIQSPESSFSDPDLCRGVAATNALGIPLPRSGNFADVYEVRCPDGSRWAVKCFTREVPGLRERYSEISRHLVEARLGFTVDFSYLEQGIRIRGEWYPILKMEWVEGFTLNEFLRRYLDDGEMLEALLRIWAQMAIFLRESDVGHGDLQHGNVLLVPGSSAGSLALKLIDYDGMWVPALRGKNSGEFGHPSYQHPQRLRDKAYSLEVDRFPLLLIATAFRALRTGGRALWDRHDNGDNLLFHETDLAEPTKSSLFAELLRLNDPVAKSLVNHLLEALRGSLESAPLLEDVLPGGTTPASTPAPRSEPAGADLGPRWFYQHDGQQRGPVGPDELLRLAKTGDLLPLDMIWREGENVESAVPAEAALSFDAVPEAAVAETAAPPAETYEPSLAPTVAEVPKAAVAQQPAAPAEAHEPPAPSDKAAVPEWLPDVARVEEAAQVPTANDVTPPDWLDDVAAAEANPPPPEPPELTELPESAAETPEAVEVVDDEEVIVEGLELVEEVPVVKPIRQKGLPPPPKLPPRQTPRSG